MTRIFIICLSIISAGTAYITLTRSEDLSGTPILTWVTDPNPARYEQIDFFHDWLIAQGHTDENGDPIVRIQLETGGVDNKKIIHGVSGVAGDILDMYNEVDQFKKLGILEDLTDYADRYGFGPDQTYDAIKNDIVIGGKQFAFPCNVTSHACWINMDVMQAAGIDQLPESWTVEAFERIGKKFVQNMNSSNEAQNYFFMNNPGDDQFVGWITVLMRSKGGSFYNETMTECILDQGPFAEMIDLNIKWIEEDRIFPNAAEASSFSASGGYGGAKMSLFLEGKYGMINLGRWLLVRMREMENPPKVAVSRYPYFDYENTTIGSRCSSIYKGSKHKDLAALFLAFLASDKYNNQIVDCADALPPNPNFCSSQRFLRPSEYPNEWGAHGAAFRSADEVAIPDAKSLFISQQILGRELRTAFEKVQSKLSNSAIASLQAAEAVNEEIKRNVSNSLRLEKKFKNAIALQAKIDAFKKAGKKIPVDWISNPFLKKYYRSLGMLEETK